MAGENRVPYIIDIEASFDKFKQQMKSGEVFNKGDIKAFNSFLTKALKSVNAEASQVGVNLQKGLNVDTTDLEKKLQFISGIFDEMGKSKNPISDWAEKGKSVYRAFDNLQTSVATLAQNVATMQTGLNNLTTSFKSFSDAYKSFDPAKFSNVVKPLEGIDVTAMKNASEQVGKYTKDIEELQVELDELSKTNVKIKVNTKDIVKSFRDALNQVKIIEDEIDDLSYEMGGGSELSSDEYDKKMISLAKKEAEKAKLYRKMHIIDSHYKKSSGTSLFSDEGIIENPKEIIAEAKKKLSETINVLNKELPKSTQKGAQAGIPIGVNFKIPSEKDLISIINTCIDNINSSKSLHKIKVELGDEANIIEDKIKRAYGDSPEDDDANTTKLVTQTESRFDRIAEAIDKKQGNIIDQTKKWRKQMLEQFKFNSGDFEFKFNDTLVESLQSLFDDYALKVNIDPQYLADQIKTVLSDGGVSLGGGTANIDANSMAMAIATGLRAVLTGEVPQVPISDGNVGDNGDISEEVTLVATEIKQSARHLDLAEDYVKDVVNKLYAVSKYATKHIGTDKDAKGAIETRQLFDRLGIDLSKIKTAGDVGNNTEIVSIIENSLLQKDEFGNLKGSTLPSELSGFKGSSSKTIPAFLASMNEVFFMLQEDTQTVEEWTRKRHDKEIFDSAREKALAASELRNVRSPIRQGNIPSMQSIENAISLMSAIGRNTDDLETLKTAREALGDKTDDASIDTFKTAADLFYKSSTKVFYDLKKQAEDTFKGTVYLEGRNKGTIRKTSIDTYKDLAKIKDDAVIVDVEVHSSLNNVALGEVKSKSSNRASAREEERLMRGAKADYLTQKKYEEDILNKQLSYSGFKVQGASDVAVDLGQSFEVNQKRKDALLAEIKVKEEEKNSLDAEIAALDKKIEELTQKNKTISDSRRKAATEKVADYELTKKQLEHEILLLEEKVGNEKTGEEAKIGSLSKDIEESLRKRAFAEKQLAELSEEDVERKKKSLNAKILELEEESPDLQKNLTQAQARQSIAESERVMAQADVFKAESALKAIPDTKKNETARVEAENVVKKAKFTLSDAVSKVNETAKDVEYAISEIERNARQISNIKGQISTTTLDSIREEQLHRIRAIDDAIKSLESEFESLLTQKHAKDATLIKINKELDKSRNVVPLRTQRELDSAVLNRQGLENQKKVADTTIENNKNEVDRLFALNKRIQAEHKYNELQEKALMLQGSIKKMEEDGATEKALKKKRTELEKVNTELSEAKEKVESLGGFIGQQDTREYSDSEKKTYALEQLRAIEDDLITAKAQQRVVASRISKKDSEIAELDKWGVGAGIGASALNSTKRDLTSQFMSSDYVKSLEDALKEKVYAALNESENKSREIFDKKVTTSMDRLGWNPLDQIQVKKFLDTKQGKQLSSDFAAEVDFNKKYIWEQYDEHIQDLHTKLRTEFKESLKSEKGVVSAKFKTQDETGKWIDEIVEVRVKEALKTRLENEKKILEAQQKPIIDSVDRLETDKKAAIEYGGVTDKELLSAEIIEDQIRKEEILAKKKIDLVDAQAKLNELEDAGVSHKDESYKSAKKEVTELEKQIARYEMLVKDRQKLAQMRYDETNEHTYTDEEKELHFTNQLVNYNQKIEDSLARQNDLRKKIKESSGDEKTKLQYRLQKEEENVAKWREKIPTYENKLNRLQTSKTQGVVSAILPEGGIVGSIVSAIGEVVGSLGTGVEINTEDLAKDATLQAILAVLGGAPSGLGGDSDGLGRGRDEQISDSKSLYKSWNVKPQDLDFDTVKTKAVALKQVIDTLYDEGKSDTQEFINAQTELSKLLSSWRNKIGKTTNPELYGKTGKENWTSYLTSGDTKIFDNLDNVELSSISQKDYLSRLKKVGVEPTVTKPEINEGEATLQIKDFNEFKLQAQALKQAIEAQNAGSEEQKKIQAALVQVLQAWARTEASGFGGKLPNVEGWKTYLTQTGVFDEIDTSITPLTNRQLNKGSKIQEPVPVKITGSKPSKKTEKTSIPETKTRQQATSGQTTGGLVQIVSRLATENTLLQVLSALQTLGTVEGGITAPTAAGDLYNQFKALLLGGSIDDHERLAYINSKDGLISGNVIGNIANISDELIKALRAKYPATQGFDTQVHTHGKATKPYFSTDDYNHFTKDYESGIKKQVLLTKDHISVLDLSAVKSAEEVQALMNELIKAGNNAKAIKKVFDNNKSGAIYESAKFDSLNANSLVKMIGANVGQSKDSNGAFDSYISKIQEYKKVISNAQVDGYLMDDDINVERFMKASEDMDRLIKSVEQGVPVTDELKANFEQLYRNTIDYGNAINKTIGKNKNMYSGLSEINSVNKQRDKIIGVFGDDKFKTSDMKLVQQYNEAYEKLHKTYQGFAKDRTLYDTNNQEQLRQQAASVEILGKKLMSSIQQADDLHKLVDQTGYYFNTQTGKDEKLGGVSSTLSAEETSVKNLESTMRNYVQNTLKQANIENVKYNSTKQQLVYTLRTSKDTVADMVVQYNAAENALFAYNKQERESLTGWPAFIQGMKSKIKSITQYMFSITSITRVWGEIRKGLQYIREIDSALTELKKVTDETEETYDKFLDTAAKTADKIGSTIKEVVSSTADFARLGYSMQEAATMAESAQVLMNVSEFTDISTATDSLISSIQAFKYTAEESMDVVDILNTIGNNYAISTADLATSLTKSSGSLVAANSTLEEAVALTATANTIIQDADVVGTALKTVAMRLRGTSTEEMEEEGLDIDGAVTSKSKLQSKIKSLSGVNILTNTGAYKSTYQILSEIANVWEDISDMDQAALLELLAGKRAGSVMSAILQNPETLKDAFESANKASGSALAENEKYLDSIQGRIDLFNNAIQTMWSTELDSGVVKLFVDLGTSLVKIVDNLGLINALVFGLMSYLTIFKKNKYDFASMLGIHSIESGWFNNKQKSYTDVKSATFQPIIGEQMDIFSDEYQTQMQLNEKIQQLNIAKNELKSLKKTKWKDIEIPDDAITYTTSNRKRTYLNEVLIPNKEQDIATIEKDIDDITRAVQSKIDQSKTKIKEDANGQFMFDFDDNVSDSKTRSKYFNIFENGLAKGATEKLTYDTKQLGIELDKLNGMDNAGVVNYMQNLDNLGDVGEDTKLTLAAYASTVEDGNYTLQGAQKYVKNYNQNLAKLSKEATIAQFKQNMLNLAISAMTMLLTTLITELINRATSAQDEFEKLSSQLSSTNSELNDINSELDNTNKKIEELLNKGSLSFTEQEELERLRAQNEELKIQKELKEAIQAQQQKGVNSASVKAANNYYKNTGKNSGKTTGEIAGQGAQYGAMAGGAIAAAGGAAVLGSSITTALTAAGTAIAPGVGTLIGILAGLVITGVGAAVGAGIGAGIGAAEEKVGESMDNMREQYTKLQEEYNAAQSKYATKSSDGNYKKMQKAQEKLTEYESMMANSIAEMDAYYSQIDLSVYDPIKDAEEIERLRNEMNDFYDTQDKWLIQSGSQGAKSNAISRIFGENSSQELKNIDKQIKETIKSGGEVDFYGMFNSDSLADTKQRLAELGISITDLKYYYLDWKETEEETEGKTYETVKSANVLTSSIGALKDAFSEFQEEGLVTADTLVGLYDTFGPLGDAWDNYVDVMAGGTSSTKEAREATEELLEALMNQHLDQGPIKDMKQYLALIGQLQNLGVSNAKGYVDALQKTSMISSIAQDIATDQARINELEAKKKKNGGKGRTKEEIKEQEKLEKKTKDFNNYIQNAEEEYGIDLSDEEKTLLLEKAITAEKAKQNAASAQTKANEYDEAVRKKEEAEQELRDAQQKAKDAKDDLDSWQYSSISGNYYRGGSESDPNAEVITEAQFSKKATLAVQAEDAVEEAQEKLKKIEVPTYIDVDEVEQEAEDAQDAYQQALDDLGLTIQIELYESGQAVDDAQSIFDTLVGAQKEYNESGYITTDTLQSLLELDAKYLDLLIDENGNLNLNKNALYGVARAKLADLELTQQKSLWENAANLSLKGSTEALREQIEVMEQSTANAADYVEQQAEVVKANLAARVSAGDMTQAEADAFLNGLLSQSKAITSAFKIVRDNLENTWSSSGNTVKEDATDAFKKAMEYYENRIGAEQSRFEQIQNEVDLFEKQGKIAGEAYYEEQIASEERRLSLLQQQKEEAQKYLGTFKEGSDEWFRKKPVYWETNKRNPLNCWNSLRVLYTTT